MAITGIGYENFTEFMSLRIDKYPFAGSWCFTEAVNLFTF